MRDKKNIILVGGHGESTWIVLNYLRNNKLVDSAIIEQQPSKFGLIHGRIKKLGYRNTIGQLFFQIVAVPLIKAISRDRIKSIIQSKALDNQRPKQLEIHSIESINSKKAIRLLRELSPVLVIVNGTRIISEEVLSSINVPFINIHAGITPLYRGVHGGYWALTREDKEHCGVTIHLVNKGIDTGEIIAQANIRTESADTFATYPYLQIAEALILLKDASTSILSGKEIQCIPPPDGISQLWYHPTIFQYLYYLIRKGVK